MTAVPPLVTVLMPVYNGEKYVRQAIDSILCQTWRDFEFVVVDDGSTDRTAEILRSYGSSLHTHTQAHQGIVQALNVGLKLANGRYIARMDADDVADSQRLEKQVQYMEQHPEVGLLGTALRWIDSNDRNWMLQPTLTDDLVIRWRLLFANAFAHSTIMMRRDILEENQLSYDEAYYPVEDYDLWSRLLTHTLGANLPESLLRYRLHSGSITSKSRDVMLTKHRLVALRMIREHLPEFAITPEEVGELIRLLFRLGEPTSEMEAQTVRLVGLYLDMFTSYVNKYNGRSGLNAVRREVGLRTARILFRPPYHSGWYRALWRLLATDPLLPGHLFMALPHAITSSFFHETFNNMRHDSSERAEIDKG